jgi:hypothetical protein
MGADAGNACARRVDAIGGVLEPLSAPSSPHAGSADHEACERGIGEREHAPHLQRGRDALAPSIAAEREVAARKQDERAFVCGGRGGQGARSNLVRQCG